MTAVNSLPRRSGTCVELFTGLGGLAIGLHDAGFEHTLLVERDAHATKTLRDNPLTDRWPLHDADLRELDLSYLCGQVDVLAAGVPCQPFSQAGAHAGPADERNMFPETFAAIRQLRPKAVLIENVRGLARPAFRPFVDYIVDHLALPSLARRPRESWPAHHERLRIALARSAADPSERYHVEWRPVCVADYGVAQRRVRILMVAVRGDYANRWRWPKSTHSHEVLLLDQLDGFYWAEKELTARSPVLAKGTRDRVRKIKHPAPLARWRTLRDVISDLPQPAPRSQRAEVDAHIYWPGARLYRGHRGSDLDLPSKTIKAGVHGVAGGEHIVHLDGNEYRYLTVRECMRVQDLPDELIIDAPRSVAMRQIGNAVPPTIGRVFGMAIADAVCEPVRVPKQVHVRDQDAAAGGYLMRQAIVSGQRVTASVRLQKERYAYLYWTRSAGKPIYLGRVAPGSRQARLTEAWKIAHERHGQLFFVAHNDRAA